MGGVFFGGGVMEYNSPSRLLSASDDYFGGGVIEAESGQCPQPRFGSFYSELKTRNIGVTRHSRATVLKRNKRVTVRSEPAWIGL